MLVLATQNGDFLLHNATRIDFYRQEEKAIWTVSMSIDGYKFPLHAFEGVTDSVVFTNIVRREVLKLVSDKYVDDGNIVRLNEICQKALKRVENCEDDEDDE